MASYMTEDLFPCEAYMLEEPDRVFRKNEKRSIAPLLSDTVCLRGRSIKTDVSMRGSEATRLRWLGPRDGSVLVE